MRRRIVLVAGAGIAAAIALALTAGMAQADPPEDENPITGDALARASAAALAHTGGGKVTDTEVGDEEGAYEVEVTGADGIQVDVHLDEGFTVVGTEPDGPEDGPR